MVDVLVGLVRFDYKQERHIELVEDSGGQVGFGGPAGPRGYVDGVGGFHDASMCTTVLSMRCSGGQRADMVAFFP